MVKYSGTFSDRFSTNDEIEAIVVCAQRNGLGIAHDDAHFDELAKLDA